MLVFAYLYRSCVYIFIYATCCGIDVVLITLTLVVLMFLMLLCSYSYIVLYKYYNHTFAVVADNQAGYAKNLKPNKLNLICEFEGISFCISLGAE